MGSEKLEVEIYKRIFEVSPDAILVVDPEGRITKVNAQVARMFGYSETELLGQTIEILIPQRLTPQHIKYRSGYWAASRIRPMGTGLALFGRRKDASEFAVDIMLTPIELDEGMFTLCVVRDILEPKQTEAEAELRVREARYRGVIENCADGFWLVDTAGCLVEVNNAYVRRSGYTRAELLEMRVTELEAKESPEETAAHIETVIRDGSDLFESLHRTKQGEVWPVEINTTYLAIEGGRFVVFIRDITERRQAESDLRLAATAFETTEAIMIIDRDGTILRVNSGFSSITGYSFTETVGTKSRLFCPVKHKDPRREKIVQALLENGRWEGEIQDCRKNGEAFPAWLSIKSVYDQVAQITHHVATFFDITERKRAEAKIQRLAYFDPLTALPNRRLFLDRLTHSLATHRRSRQGAALFFIDIDHFKHLNDGHGHSVGDILLREVAARLSNSLREEDTVGRLGGDEFVVLLEGLPREPATATFQALTVADKLQHALQLPFDLPSGEQHITASIGITLFPRN
jgi:diguanylate cyclase (GGDEF)-like protein/PAS domain S-box-containing protein